MNKAYKQTFYFLGPFFCLLLFSLFLKISHIGFNLTGSLPIGFYQRVDKYKVIQRGDIVRVCLPEALAREGMLRGYLIAGDCPSGSIALLKKVIALPGDSVTVTREGIKVNTLFYHAPSHRYDRHGDKIKRFIGFNTYPNQSNYWLYGSHDFLWSWDSRYYGGVNQSAITSLAKPVLTF